MLGEGAVFATRASFKTASPPKLRECLQLFELYSADDMAIIRQGLVPRDMDDRWFMFFENDSLHIFRSWTGYQIFALHFAEAPDGGATLSGGWVNRDAAQFSGDCLSSDAALALDLISSHLLTPQRHIRS